MIKSGFFFFREMALEIIFSDIHRRKIIALRQTNLNWDGLGVQACHIQLFSSLDVYLQHNFSQL